MEEELVSFETAKLAKEKGFGWKVSLHYESNGNRFFDKVECNFNNVELICSAPTKSLLQKWLRDVHKTIVQIECNYYDDKLGWNTYSVTVCYGQHNQETRSFYKTYEEALEIGLQEALKLIK